MGLPDSYPLPSSYNDGYHLVGDGVVVPVVAWLEIYLLRPLTAARGFERVA
jgi:DNA (cytosine-5)-methyltransferase 1